MKYKELREFIMHKMKPDKSDGVEKNYQPVVIRFLNKTPDGSAEKDELLAELKKENLGVKITSRNLKTVTDTLIGHKIITTKGKSSFRLLDFESWKNKFGSKAEITKQCDKRINGSNYTFFIVENKDELKNAHDTFIDSLTNLTTKSQTMKVNTPGGGSTHEINWIETLEIWWLTEIKDSGKSYWDVFGTDEPNWSKPNAPEIKLEINAPTKGRNKRTQGQFVKDENGDVYLCHSGVVNVQSGADEPFWKVYSGPAPWIKPVFGDGSLGDYLLISKLSDKKSPEQIAEYVNAVNSYKISQKEKKEKNSGNIFEVGHRLFLLEISQTGSKIPFENFDHAEFRKREVDWKLEVLEKAKKILSLDKWDEWKSNPEKIFTAVRDASAGKISRQLVWSPPHNTDSDYFDKFDDKTRIEFGSQLFDFFKGEDAIGEKYDKLLLFLKKEAGYDQPRLLAYLSFLLDSQKYFPILPSNFDKLVEFFEKPATKEHSWKKYSSYLKMAYELKSKLDDMYSTNLTTIEIQSYMWVLAVAVSKNFFMIRAGTDGHDWENQKNLGIIGIGYVPIDLDEYLNKNKTISKSKVKRKWQEIRENESKEPFTKKQLDIRIGQLDRFHKIKKDDKIVAIGKNSELLGVGNATGGYKFRIDSRHHHHTVPVDWYDTDAREMPMQTTNITVKDLTAREYSVLMDSQGNTHSSGDYKKYRDVLEWKPNLILYGPPGTGKTYIAKKIAKEITSSNSLRYRDFEKAFPEKLIQQLSVQKMSDDEYGEFVLESIKKEAEENGYDFKIEKENYNFILEKGKDKIHLRFTYSKSTTNDIIDCYCGIDDSVIDFLKKAPENNRYIITINHSVKNFVVLPYSIEQKHAKFAGVTNSDNWDPTGVKSHSYHIKISDDEVSFVGTDYDCKKFIRNIKMIFGQFIKNLTFHQTFSYEEFIEGIKAKPTIDGKGVTYDVESGIFKEFCSMARMDDSKNQYIMIIDEINRGNIAKIFGELITIIEKDKRGDTVVLAYSKEEFSVPKNILIIGTMNTADQSLTSLDAALKRRFVMMEHYPVSNVLENYKVEGKIDLTKLLDKINKNLRKNNFRDGQIGHSYFMNGEVPVTQISELQMIFAYSIIPQLRDYFYDDESKIKDILGNSWLHEDGDTKKEWQGADGMDVFYKNIQDLLGE